jgi:hypothetical protein
MRGEKTKMLLRCCKPDVALCKAMFLLQFFNVRLLIVNSCKANKLSRINLFRPLIKSVINSVKAAEE